MRTRAPFLPLTHPKNPNPLNLTPRTNLFLQSTERESRDVENKPSNHRACIYPEQTKGQNYVWITRRPSRGKSSATGRSANRTAAAYLLTCAISAIDSTNF